MEERLAERETELADALQEAEDANERLVRRKLTNTERMEALLC